VIGIGVIGYGYWGPNLVRNFMERSDATVRHLSDLDAGRLAVAKARYPTIVTSTDYTEMLSDPKVDAVVIATPVATHYPLAKAILESGRHVLIEKPMTDRSETAEELIALAARKGKVIMVDHTFIYSGPVRKMKEIIDSGELGELYYVDSVRVNLGLFQQDVNVLWDLGAHDIAIMNWLIGSEPLAVSAIGAAHFKDGAEDIAYMTALYPNNCIAHLHTNWLAPVKVRMTLIGGSRRMIVYDDMEPSEKIKVYDKGMSVTTREDIYRILVQYRAGDMHAPRLDQTEPLSAECAHFLDCIRTGATPITGGELGLSVVRILDAAQRSLKEQGRLVPLRGSAEA